MQKGEAKQVHRPSLNTIFPATLREGTREGSDQSGGVWNEKGCPTNEKSHRDIWNLNYWGPLSEIASGDIAEVTQNV